MREITQYLKDVAALECQLYTQNRLQKNLRDKLETMGHARSFEEPKDGSQEAEVFGGIASFLYFFAGLTFLLLPMSLFAAIIAFLIGLLRDLNVGFLSFTLWCYLIMSLIVIVICYYFERREKATKKKRYAEELKKYRAAIQADRKRVEREMVWRRDLLEQWHRVKEKRVETQNALDSLYAVGLIHPKYRKLVAVATFYDYFDTGRCSALTGPGGAYDTYEYEQRMGRIETKLDVIISKLDEIIANQQYIGDLMREANATLYRIEKQNDNMIRSMNNIQENTALTEYNSRCAAQSAAVMEHIAVYHALKYE